MYFFLNQALFPPQGSFSTVYLAESSLEKGGFAAVKVVQKGDLVKTRKIPKVRGHHSHSSQQLVDSSDVTDSETFEYEETVTEDLTWLIDREIKVSTNEKSQQP